MPQKIGIRELKNQTSNIVRRVREETVEVEILSEMGEEESQWPS